MKKKILILLTITFLLTGCTVNYNLRIYPSKIIESVTITGLKSNLGKGGIETIKEEKLPASIITGGNYVSTYKEKDNYSIVNYNYSHNIEKFEKSYFLNKCYENNDIKIDGNILSISTSEIFNCYNMYGKIEKTEIVIETSSKVNENNADKVKGNKYIWYIDQGNYQNKPINIKVDISSNYEYLLSNTKEIMIVMGTIVGIILIIILFIVNKKRKINKI